MSEMVKRVARAIYAHDFMLSVGWEGSQIIARAAIAAMRTPERHMLIAGGKSVHEGGTTFDCWVAMVDAALTGLSGVGPVDSGNVSGNDENNEPRK